MLENYLQYITLGVAICIVMLCGYQKLCFLYWKKKGVAYLAPTILFGNAFPICKKEMGLGELTALTYKEIKNINRHFGGYFIFHYPVFMPIDPELIKHVLVRDFQSFHDRGYNLNERINPLSAQLVCLEGNKWKRNREKFKPTFTLGNIKLMFQGFLKCSKEFDNILENSSKTEESIDINDILGRYTTDIIASCAFDYKESSLINPNTDFRKCGKMVESVFKNQVLFGIAIYLPHLYKLLNIPLINDKINKFFYKITKNALEYRVENNIKRQDYFDLYIKMNNKLEENDADRTNEDFSFNELASIGFAFHVGGYETTTNTMTFGLYELSVNQHIQDILREEITRVLINYDGEVTYEAIMDMTYMDQVINEILRKYPPIPILNRKCSKTYQIPGTDVIIDKGVRCWISVLGLHRDPEYYPDPEKFDPQRFTREENVKRHPFTYFPFGDGPRMCLGKKFGILQIKVALTKLIKNYKFTIDPKTSLPIGLSTEGIFLSPKNKIWLQCFQICR